MLFKKIAVWLKDQLVKMNEEGIPLPLIRDNHLDKGTLPGTMFVVSFTVAILLLIGKVTHLTGEIDYTNVLWLLGLTGSFWVTEALGRKVKFDAEAKSVDIGDSIDKKDAT